MESPAGLKHAPWAARLPRTAASWLVGLRDHPDVEVLVLTDAIWLRAQRRDDDLDRAVAAIPDAERFGVDEDGDCRLPQRHIPVAHVPGGSWTNLRELCVPEAPRAALPAEAPAAAALRLERGGDASGANVLIVRFAALARWVSTAAAVRCRPLRFAADARGNALVHGAPVAPLPGAAAFEQHGVAVPLGWRLQPQLPPQLVATRLRLRAGDLALFDDRRRCTLVRDEQFAAVTRGAIQATAARCHDG